MSEFGSHTFHRDIADTFLPKDVNRHLIDVTLKKTKIHLSHIDTIAEALKKWAVSQGATHYCHWFQPLTGFASEKHDSFIGAFSGQQLLKGEPDASSFPSGGLRNTAEARGYTSWDPITPPFIFNRILCLPSFFFSWKGEALDFKIPLIRSEIKLEKAVLRLFKFLKISQASIHVTLGCEQEYFLVDRDKYLKRYDLHLIGRTLCGAPLAKGQQLEDHYFRVIPPRILTYMEEVEKQACSLGIPLKTRHAEVAPSQYEVAPIFESSSVAVDHNILLMELMKQTAYQHNLACIFHEKPFAGINGSGKHCNWSISTDTGFNLFHPTESPHTHLFFLLAITALLDAVYLHSDLLMASIATPGNDYRLGGHEAPPPIISVCLGNMLTELVESLSFGKKFTSHPQEKIDLIITSISKDYSDRNRTSPFVFTGNKFEFRAVGASANCALPLFVLNSLFAHQLDLLMEELEGGRDPYRVMQDHLKESKNILFSGNGYSQQWVQEAKKRKLPIFQSSSEAIPTFLSKKAEKVFEGVLSKNELKAYAHTLQEQREKYLEIEKNLLQEIFYTGVLPAAKRSKLPTNRAQVAMKNLQNSPLKGLRKRLDRAREEIDTIENHLEAKEWPLPKYRELLFFT